MESLIGTSKVMLEAGGVLHSKGSITGSSIVLLGSGTDVIRSAGGLMDKDMREFLGELGVDNGVAPKKKSNDPDND
jgi:hypothetical protein